MLSKSRLSCRRGKVVSAKRIGERGEPYGVPIDGRKEGKRWLLKDKRADRSVMKLETQAMVASSTLRSRSMAAVRMGSR